MEINSDRLDDTMDYIYWNHSNMIMCGVVLTSMAFAAFILASLFTFIYFMNNPVKKETEEDLANKERLGKIAKHQNFEMEFDGQDRTGFLVE